MITITWNNDHGTFWIKGRSGKVYNFFTPYDEFRTDQEQRLFAMSTDVLKDIPFGKSNNFSKSAILSYLKEIWEDLQEGKEEFYYAEFEQDLTSIYEEEGAYPIFYANNGVSIPDVSFFREHEDVFKKFPSQKAWWLATPNGVGVSRENSSIFVPPQKMIIDYNGTTTLQFTSSRSSCGVRPMICMYPDGFAWD
jgi:hypothetical protein